MSANKLQKKKEENRHNLASESRLRDFESRETSFLFLIRTYLLNNCRLKLQIIGRR